MIDRRIGLKIFIERGTLYDIAVHPTDERAGSDAGIEAERTADRDNPVANMHFVAVSKWKRGQPVFRLNSQQCQVRLAWRASDRGGVIHTVSGHDVHRSRALYHVLVGRDVS